MERALLPALALGLLASGCYDSSSADDGGIVLMIDTGPPAPRVDAGGPAPGIDAGTPPPPPPPRDAGSSGGFDFDADVPTIEGGVGASCSADSDCGLLTNGICQTTVGGGFGSFTFPGGYCSAECTPGGDECGPGGDCFSVGFGGFGFSFCAKACVRDENCRVDEGYTCQEPPFVGGGPYCLPPFGGPGSDAGPPPDAGPAADAGPDPADAGASDAGDPDAGDAPDGGGATDASAPSDGGPAPGA